MTRFRMAAKAAATLAVALCMAAPMAPQAVAAPTAQGQGAPTALIMTVADGTEHAQSGAHSVVLFCTPPAGDHPASARACADLSATDGSFTVPPAHDTFCYFIYQPVTVTAEGLWKGQAVFYQRSYPNRCMMLRATGGLFSF
jgi:hypothetical protein